LSLDSPQIPSPGWERVRERVMKKVGLLFVTQYSCRFAFPIASNRNAHMLGELITVGSNLPHLLIDVSMVIPFATLPTHPSRNVLDNDQ
jgi:hypothetical protein